MVALEHAAWVVVLLLGGGCLGATISTKGNADGLLSRCLAGIPLGIGALLLIGGCLGAFHLYRVGMLSTLAAVSLLGGIWTSAGSAHRLLAEDERTFDRWSAVSLIIIAATFVACFRYWSVSALNSDDTIAYLPLAKLLAQTGGFSPQPFSERSLFSLNGVTPIIAEADAFFGIRGARSVDVGLGLLGAVLFLAGLGLRKQRRASCCAAMTVLCASLLRPSMVLVTLAPQFLQALFLLYIVFTIDEDWFRAHGLSARRMISLAVTVAALSSLRTSNVPLIALLCLATLRSSESDIGRRVFRVGILAVACAVLLTPLMVASFASGSTLFFPYLGRGLHASAAGLATLAGEATPLHHRLMAAFESVARTPFFLFTASVLWIASAETSRQFMTRIATCGVVGVGWFAALHSSGSVLVGEQRLRTNPGESYTSAGALVVDALGCLAFLLSLRLARGRWTVVAAFAAWAALIAYSGGGTGTYRYAFPALATMLAVFVTWSSITVPWREPLLTTSMVAAVAIAAAVTFFAPRDSCCSIDADSYWGSLRSVVKDSLPPTSRVLSAYQRNDLLADAIGSRLVLYDQPGFAGPVNALRALRGEADPSCLAQAGIDAVVYYDSGADVDSILTMRSPVGSWEDSLQAGELRMVRALRRAGPSARKIWRAGPMTVLMPRADGVCSRGSP